MTDKKKIIAPIVVTILLILYFALYFGFLIYALSGFWRYFLIVVPIIFAALVVYVCIERINEIKEGEENDISKY